MDNDGWIPGQWIYEEWRDAIDLRGQILAIIRVQGWTIAMDRQGCRVDNMCNEYIMYIIGQPTLDIQAWIDAMVAKVEYLTYAMDMQDWIDAMDMQRWIANSTFNRYNGCALDIQWIFKGNRYPYEYLIGQEIKRARAMFALVTSHAMYIQFNGKSKNT